MAATRGNLPGRFLTFPPVACVRALLHGGSTLEDGHYAPNLRRVVHRLLAPVHDADPHTLGLTRGSTELARRLARTWTRS